MTVSFVPHHAHAAQSSRYLLESFIRDVETFDDSKLNLAIGALASYIDSTHLLFIASQRGLVGITKCLLERQVGAHLQMNPSDAPDPWTPLHEAVNNQHEQVAKVICFYRPDFMSFISEYESDVISPASLAIRKGNILSADDLITDSVQLSDEACYCILRSALTVNLQVFSHFLNRVIDRGFKKIDDSELYYEILQSDFAIEAFSLLREKGAHLEARDGRGFTVLHHAVFLHHHQAVDYLIFLERDGKKIFRIDDFDNTENMTPIGCAVVEADEVLIKKLLSYGALIYQENVGYFPLHLACTQGYQSIVVILLEALKKEASFSINEADESRFRAIDSAVEGGHMGVCKVLQQHGAMCDYYTLCWAAEVTPLERVGSMIEFLVNSFSINMSAPNRITKTPLHCLAYRLIGTISQRTWIEQQLFLAVTSLLAKGASMTTLDARDKTPLDLANDFQNEWFKRAFELWKASQAQGGA